jgi:hypothetical protein
MHTTTDILDFIDQWLAANGEWLPATTIDFALDVRSMVADAATVELTPVAA